MLYGTHQNPHAERPLRCAFVFGTHEHKMRGVAPDVGAGFGNSLDPRVVEGQAHGAPAQGIGQAMPEHGVNDPQPGPLRTVRRRDRSMPRTDVFCQFPIERLKGPPCTHNAQRAPGCSKAGAIGSRPVVVKPICNALGVNDVAMPAPPHAV
jgi:carbon-monoxide dehydrogenase large subunit